MIARPKKMQSSAGRELECQSAIRDEFELLTDIAERSGWRWDEIALALLELTDEYASAHRAGLVPIARPSGLCVLTKTRH
ncbi:MULTISPECIES: hypothetical protein [unclassified Ensifer]|uniref:hypothetical protein n=1 Tax=unclassified Ensifer TaxID=2633371 RepID=UPI00081390E6|nr:MULTISPECIES: hypothetical protein [unclassified Ensifer]OCP07155.1 hypothetical protein BBX50_22565 [Ensifer sp. LC11]OCP07737.1 hypothetical protein BC374_22780 [Ensifer sp. LC13]OCP12101.1 hypothetical protein BC362_06500 [Ensifer sp. LC14]OCP31811.1 hypothetical protein BC364_21920 [Ensifer sp. LC499]